MDFKDMILLINSNPFKAENSKINLIGLMMG